jgi:hypothetical protein
VALLVRMIHCLLISLNTTLSKHASFPAQRYSMQV